ncbi:PREDICTED: zinc finger protein OZF-like [Priapulus caudatus]|uniref:Zinc finger protein OZF-like n=1 Tax=Priapulus caudatus TaxID=37621 RepID=A0ABM1DTY5_PRICU|nr:PREDICTED: zinc finger protein OZF-like [Priapulus caudatus]
MHKKCHVAGHSYLKCPHCYKITTAWAHMARHLASHTGENITMARKGKVRDKSRCEKCDKQFSSSALLNLHQQRVHDDVHRFVCHECGDRFKYEKAYKRHLDLHNNVIYQCEHCKYQSKVRANIRSHMKVHEGRGQICDVCGKVFSMPSRLKKHMELHNRTADSNVVCVYCSKVYSSKATLDIHFKREHSTVCSVQCQFCDYIGKDNSYLQEHLKKKHFKEFTCNNCPYATFNEETLRRHMDTHREFRPYSCTLCYYKAREQKTLLSHMRNKHSQNESARKHVCPFCGMKFKSSSMLKAHMPTHTGDKPHHCLFCDYSAKHRATLYRHNLSKHRSLVAITLSQKQSREFYNGGGGVAAGSCDERAGEEQTTYEDGLHVLADQIEVVDYQVAATTVADNDNSARLSLRSDDDDDAAAPPAGVVVNGADVRIDEATLHHIMEATPNGGTLIIQTDGSF